MPYKSQVAIYQPGSEQSLASRTSGVTDSTSDIVGGSYHDLSSPGPLQPYYFQQQQPQSPPPQQLPQQQQQPFDDIIDDSNYPGRHTQPTSSGRHHHKKERWSWSTTVFVSAVLLLCPACIYCTMTSLLCNVFAYIDHKAGEHEREKTKQRCAIGWSIASLVGGIIAGIIIIIVLFVGYGAGTWSVLPPVPDY